MCFSWIFVSENQIYRNYYHQFSGSISGGGTIDLTEERKEEFNSFNCIVFGDIAFDSPPINLEQAIAMYQKLPSLINATGPVPKLIHLLELSAIDSKG